MQDAGSGRDDGPQIRSDGATFVARFLRGERALLARIEELSDERRRHGTPIPTPRGREAGAERRGRQLDVSRG